MTIKNKVVVITGASSGIGKATTEVLAKAGAHVVIGARRKDRLAEIAAEFGGDQVVYQETDVTNRDSVKSLVDLAQSTFGKVDVLYNNAGLMPVSPLADLKVDEWERMIDVNVKGVLYGIAAVLPIMIAQKHGTSLPLIRLLVTWFIQGPPYMRGLNTRFKPLWMVSDKNRLIIISGQR